MPEPMTSRDTLSKLQPFLHVQDLQPFGIGGRRLCLVHPNDAGKCVKVLRRDEKRTVRSRRNFIPSFLRREYDNNAHEYRVLGELFGRIGGEAGRFLPRCYGMVDTDMGRGLVVDLIRDCDGKISRSLRELISEGESPQVFRPAFTVLAEFLVRHLVVTRALLDHNIVARKHGDGSWQLYLIDGLGDPAWLPLARFFPSMARNRIRRRLEEAWGRFERLSSHPVTKEMIRKSNWGQGFLEHRG